MPKRSAEACRSPPGPAQVEDEQLAVAPGGA